MTTVADEYAKWAQLCIPGHAGEGQVRDMKRAFYSGAFMMLGLVMNLAGPADEDDAIGAERLENAERECKAFFQDVAEGRA